MKVNKTIAFICLLHFVFLSGFTQSFEESRIVSEIIKLSANITAEEQLQKISFKHSPFASYGYYHQAFNGKPVFNKWVKIKYTSNSFGWIVDESAPITEINPTFEEAFPSDGEVLSTLNNLNIKYTDYILSSGYWFENYALFPVVKAEILDEIGNHYEYILQDGKVISDQIKSRFSALDTVKKTATGLIFNPDPLTSAKTIYGGDFRDENDSDVPALRTQRVAVEFDCYQINDTFQLQSDFVRIGEISIPKTKIAISLDGDFSFTRDQAEFEDVNIFYHLNITQQYIQSLGFDDLGNFQILADPHGLNGMDQSRVTTFGGVPKMEFGEGGVDDGEDADVIVHEYAHALLYDGSPESNSGSEREAMDEAFGDYLATSYSRNISEFNWGKMFTWDGHNEYWSGRNVDNNKKYPDDLEKSIHRNGEIWSAALMDIWEEIGRETTDKLTLGMFFEMYPNMRMPQAASQFLLLDSQLTGGLNSPQISKAFFDRGLMDTVFAPPIQPDTTFKIEIMGSAGYGSNPVIVSFSKDFSGKIELFDGLGRFIWGANLTDVREVTIPYRSEKPFGIYRLRITKGFERFNYSLLKAY